MPYVNSANPGSGQNQPFDVTGYVTDICVDNRWPNGSAQPGMVMQLSYVGFNPDPAVVTGDGQYNYPGVHPWDYAAFGESSQLIGVLVGGPTLGAETYPTDGTSVIDSNAMVMTEGICQVLCDNTTVVGDYLIGSTTVIGAAHDGGTTPTAATIGTVLQAVTITSGTALVWAYVRFAGGGGGGGGGVVDSVVAGANIAVDDTDPANPVVALATNVSVAGTLVAGGTSLQDGSNNVTVGAQLNVTGKIIGTEKIIGEADVASTGFASSTANSAHGLPATSTGSTVNNATTIDVCSATSLTGSGTCDVQVSPDGVTYTDLGSVELTTTTVFTFGQLRSGWYLQFTPTGTVTVGNTVFS